MENEWVTHQYSYKEEKDLCLETVKRGVLIKYLEVRT